jgi:hypothetical protein
MGCRIARPAPRNTAMNMQSQIRDPFYSTFAAVALAVACLGALAPTGDEQAARATLSARAVPASTLSMAGYRTTAPANEQVTTGAADTAAEIADAALIVASIGSREY